VSASSGLPAALDRVDASVFDPRSALRAQKGLFGETFAFERVCESLNVPMGHVIRKAERAE
jgi:hypothetical protein